MFPEVLEEEMHELTIEKKGVLLRSGRQYGTPPQ
jgi:hypothetical protein